MRHSPFRTWLEFAEYVSFCASVVGAIAALSFHNSLYAVLPIVVSLGLNLVNRRRLEQQTKASIASAIHQLNQHKAAADQLIEQLKTAIASLSTANSTLGGSVGNAEPVQNLKPLVSAIKKLRQQHKILEQAIKLMQAELNLTSQQFKRRPELEQIESLTSVILDLQQFINQLPQWGSLQQKQLLELQAKVESALEQLSVEISNIPYQVDIAVQRREAESSQNSLEQFEQTSQISTPHL
ncbi:MAG: hypothetical protein ACM37W_18615 [Actinomycetota bacterium]